MARLGLDSTVNQASMFDADEETKERQVKKRAMTVATASAGGMSINGVKGKGNKQADNVTNYVSKRQSI